MPNSIPTLYVLWPGDTRAKARSASTMRSIAYTLSGRAQDLRLTTYATVGNTTYLRVETRRRQVVGFFVRRGNEAISCPTERERDVLQLEAARFVAERDRTSARATRLASY